MKEAGCRHTSFNNSREGGIPNNDRRKGNTTTALNDGL